MIIASPKRQRDNHESDWDGFFPYYAGFPASFARQIIETSGLHSKSTIFDPWNGSGTTTYAATRLGLHSIGFDINPAMTVVARARLLPTSEADSIEPLGIKLLEQARMVAKSIKPNNDPLCNWFTKRTAATIRSIETSIRQHLIGQLSITPEKICLDRLSALAATYYVALFSTCRTLTKPYMSSNPTWLRIPRDEEKRRPVPEGEIERLFGTNLSAMTAALDARQDLFLAERHPCEIRLTDSTSTSLPPDTVDLVLTSPPYCTRIDYTAATRVELSILAPLLSEHPDSLSRKMTGSTRVPTRQIEEAAEWGHTCHQFLKSVRTHASKASSGYYYLTHLDYFDKMNRSIRNIATSIRPGGKAILVVQDSYYKDIYNDLPAIISEISKSHGLSLVRRENFHSRRSMSRINRSSRIYNRHAGATESVLCFER